MFYILKKMWERLGTFIGHKDCYLSKVFHSGEIVVPNCAESLQVYKEQPLSLQ